MPPGLATAAGDCIAQPVGGCLHFSGTETATQWCGYIEGALAAGQRVGREVVAALMVGQEVGLGGGSSKL